MQERERKPIRVESRSHTIIAEKLWEKNPCGSNPPNYSLNITREGKDAYVVFNSMKIAQDYKRIAEGLGINLD